MGKGIVRFRLLPPLSPECPGVFCITGVRMGPGSAHPISHSTPWFSFLEKWSFSLFSPPFVGLGRVPAPLPGRGASPSSGSVLQHVPVPAAPGSLTVTHPLFNDFNRACRCMSAPLPRSAPGGLTGDTASQTRGARGSSPPLPAAQGAPRDPCPRGPRLCPLPGGDRGRVPGTLAPAQVDRNEFCQLGRLARLLFFCCCFFVFVMVSPGF